MIAKFEIRRINMNLITTVVIYSETPSIMSGISLFDFFSIELDRIKMKDQQAKKKTKRYSNFGTVLFK